MRSRKLVLAILILVLSSCSSLGGPDDESWVSYERLVGHPVEVSFSGLYPPTSVLTVETVCGTLIEHTGSHVILGPLAGRPRCQEVIPAFVNTGYLTLASVEPPRVLVPRAKVGALHSLSDSGWPILWIAIVDDASALPPGCVSLGSFSLASKAFFETRANFIVVGSSSGGPPSSEGEVFRCPE